MKPVAVSLVILGALLGSLSAVEYNGQSDPGFHGGTVRIVAFPGTGPGEAECATMDSFGRILIAGRASNGTDDDIACARFLADGTLDTSFAGSGCIQLSLSPHNDVIDGLVVCGTRIIVVTHHESGGIGVTLVAVALTASGTIDPTFGTSGRFTLSLPYYYPGITALGTVGDRMLVATSWSNGANVQVRVLSLTSDGVLDPTYGSAGSAQFELSGHTWTKPMADVAADGRLVIASSATTLSVAALTPNGQLDSGFGTNGVAAISSGTWAGFLLNDIVAAVDGSVTMAVMVPVMSGLALSGSTPAFLRLTSGGIPDSALGSNGLKSSPVPFGNRVSLAAMPSGGGWLLTNTESSGAIRANRLLSSHDLDTGFGSPGTTVGGMKANGFNGAIALVRADESVVVAGGSGAFELNAYTGSGAALPGFSHTTVAPGAPGDRAYAMLALSDGGVLLAGASGARVALARLDVVGDDNPAFQSDGQLVADLGANASLRAVAPLPLDGWLVAGGKADALLLGRLQADGTPDPAFGSGGWLTPPASGGPASALVVSGDGRILLANGVIRRFLADGTPDSSFGTSGIAAMPSLPHGSERGRLTQLLQLSDGSVLAGGDYFHYLGGTDYGYHTIICRYGSDGMLDSSFGQGGLVDRKGLGVVHIAQSGPDRLLISELNTKGLTALTANGSIDTSYGTAGTAQTDFIVTSFSIQADGQALVVGRDVAARHGLVTRITAAGAADPLFPVTAIDAEMSEVTTCALSASSGKVYVVGAARGDIVVAKIVCDAGMGASAAATPVFSPPAGSYSAPQSVAMSCATPGAVIRYTTDGSIPTMASPLYYAPITVSWDRTFRAVAFAPGTTASSPIEAAYSITVPTGGGGTGSGGSSGNGGGGGGGCGAGGGLGGMALGMLFCMTRRRRTMKP